MPQTVPLTPETSVELSTALPDETVSPDEFDEIDAILAKHYGLTNEELDFIINYDIKYRMGKELDNEEEEE